MERAISTRPLRDLLERLPLLPITSNQTVDFPAADAGLLVAIREDAETTVQVFLRGSSVLGSLLSYSSPLIADGTVSQDAVEALGFLLSELSDGAVSLMNLSAQCRIETSDWVGPKPTAPANSSWSQQ